MGKAKEERLYNYRKCQGLFLENSSLGMSKYTKSRLAYKFIKYNFIIKDVRYKFFNKQETSGQGY